MLKNNTKVKISMGEIPKCSQLFYNGMTGRIESGDCYGYYVTISKKFQKEALKEEMPITMYFPGYCIKQISELMPTE